MSCGILIEDHCLFHRLRREGALFLACNSGFRRRRFRSARVDTTFAEPVEVGMAADNSSVRILAAGMERFGTDGPRCSTARDHAEDDSGRLSLPPGDEEKRSRPGKFPVRFRADLAPAGTEGAALRHAKLWNDITSLPSSDRATGSSAGREAPLVSSASIPGHSAAESKKLAIARSSHDPS
jgi:hypothetical protein